MQFVFKATIDYSPKATNVESVVSVFIEAIKERIKSSAVIDRCGQLKLEDFDYIDAELASETDEDEFRKQIQNLRKALKQAREAAFKDVLGALGVKAGDKLGASGETAILSALSQIRNIYSDPNNVTEVNKKLNEAFNTIGGLGENK